MRQKFRRFRALACLGIGLAALPSLAPRGYAEETRPATRLDPSPNSRKELLEREQEEIPKEPSAPPALGVAKPATWDTARCPRNFVYRGKSLNCDSNLGWDGENLRPIIQRTPEAVAELDEYQRNRAKVESLRYVGSAGLLLMGAGLILGQTLNENNPDRIMIRNLGLLGGAALAAGSFTWGLAIVKSNEARLGKAVDLYNQANPKDPIELQFSTGITF